MTARPTVTTNQNEEGELGSPAEELNPASQTYGIRRRAILFGAVLIPLNCQWIILMERVMFGPYPSTVSLFANAVFALFVLVGVNRLLERWLPRLAFSRGELLTIYTMIAISIGLAGLDGISTICQMMPHGVWFASSTNGWSSFFHYFPKLLVIGDRDIAGAHYLGHSSLYDPAVFAAWAPRALIWSTFVTVLLLVVNCLNVLVRAQWSDRERLTFPIISLPLQMTDNESGFFKNRVMWLGFGLAGGMNFWNGLAAFVPTMPSIPLGIYDLHPLLIIKPWDSISWLPVTFYPFVIGLGFLLPLDICLSCVLFFFYWKAQVVVCSAMAWDSKPDFPFVNEQGFGSIIGLFACYLWSGRRHYASIWKQAIGRSNATRGHEALSPRSALLTAGIGVIALVAFGCAAGAAWWVSVAFVGLYLLTAMVITRIRAELGPPVHDFHFMGPSYMLPRVTGASGMSGSDLAFLTMTSGLMRAHRSDTAPIGLEAMQMANQAKYSARRTFIAIMIATALGCISTFWAYEDLAYRQGAAVHFHSGLGSAHEAFDRMQGWSQGTLDSRPVPEAVMAMAFGLLCTVVLFALRLTVPGFPLHPIGYAVSSSWAIHLIWCPLLIAGIAKWIIIRYTGYGGYRKATPFFLGLILGDCVVGSIWGLVGYVLKTPTYNFFGA